MLDRIALRQQIEKMGGEGSGNFGHAGRPGEVGGSGGGDKKEYPKTAEGRIQKLNDIKTGTKIRFNNGLHAGKTFVVLGLNRVGGKQNRTDLGILEEGRPESEESKIRYGPKKGEPIEISNIEHRTIYATGGEQGTDSFDIIEV